MRPRGVLDRLGLSAKSLRLFSSRLNRNWLAQSGDDRFVLRQYRRGRTIEDANYELRVMDHLARAGWPVPTPIKPPIEAGGYSWCAFTYLPGRSPAPRSEKGIRAEQSARGRLMAEVHGDLLDLNDLGQRKGWVRAEQLLPPEGNEPFANLASRRPEEASVLRWHLDRARELFEQLNAAAQPAMIIHGDFASWNLRYLRGRVSGIYDFEFSHLNHRVADFALSWRGIYDEVVQGYFEVAPLSDVELQLITPVWWAWLLDNARTQLFLDPEPDLSWVLTHLVRRSPLVPI